jgi:hypothetical protein
MCEPPISRRDFMKAGTAGTASLAVGVGMLPQRPAAGLADPPVRAAAMATRPLGRAGHEVRLFSLGGQATR